VIALLDLVAPKFNYLRSSIFFKILAVLRIHLILMWIRIQILDPYWKKMDPNPGSQNVADP